VTSKARKLMPDDPITLATLTQFHREVLLPDMQRLVGESEQRLQLRMDAQFDAVYQRFDRLETEYQMVVAGLKRLEERLDGVESRLSAVEQTLERVALRSEFEALKARVDSLQAQLRALEARLSA
jgi:predicted  nucleic acid-binding Zn-ribbon protein